MLFCHPKKIILNIQKNHNKNKYTKIKILKKDIINKYILNLKKNKKTIK
jgi:hypothetical protein